MIFARIHNCMCFFISWLRRGFVIIIKYLENFNTYFFPRQFFSSFIQFSSLETFECFAVFLHDSATIQRWWWLFSLSVVTEQGASVVRGSSSSLLSGRQTALLIQVSSPVAYLSDARCWRHGDTISFSELWEANSLHPRRDPCDLWDRNVFSPPGLVANKLGPFLVIRKIGDDIDWKRCDLNNLNK